MVVKEAGCGGPWVSDTLQCLRELPYDKLLFAMNSPPFALSYSAVALSYLPRPDGKVLTQSPDVLVLNGKFAKVGEYVDFKGLSQELIFVKQVPFIIGDQEDEGIS
jgi:hypothetical protein